MTDRADSPSIAALTLDHSRTGSTTQCDDDRLVIRSESQPTADDAGDSDGRGMGMAAAAAVESVWVPTNDMSDGGSSGDRTSGDDIATDGDAGATSDESGDDINLELLVEQEDMLRELERLVDVESRRLTELQRYVFGNGSAYPQSPQTCVQRITERQLERQLLNVWEFCEACDHCLAGSIERRSAPEQSDSMEDVGSPSGMLGDPSRFGARRAEGGMRGVGGGGRATTPSEYRAGGSAAAATTVVSARTQELLQRPANHELRRRKRRLCISVRRTMRRVRKLQGVMWDYLSGSDD